MSPLTIIQGCRGSGKSLLAVILLEDSDRNIFSNFEIKYPKFERLTQSMLIDIENDCEIVMDEAYVWLESRSSMKYTNIFSSHVAFQLRKTNRNIFAIIQQVDTIDKRYRKEWDFFVECERYPNDSVDDDCWDFMYTFYNQKHKTSCSFVVSYEDAKSYFELFDTNEIVKVPAHSRMEYEMLKSEPLEWAKRANEMIKIVQKSKYRFNKKTKPSIEFSLIMNNFDAVWSKPIHILLNR